MHIHTCACVSHTQCTSSYEYIHICIYIREYFVLLHTCTCVSHTKCTSSYEYIHVCIYIRVYFVMLHTCTCVSHTNCTSFVRRHWPRCSCATRPISGRNGVPATHTENRSMCAHTAHTAARARTHAQGADARQPPPAEHVCCQRDSPLESIFRRRKPSSGASACVLWSVCASRGGHHGGALISKTVVLLSVRCCCCCCCCCCCEGVAQQQQHNSSRWSGEQKVPSQP